MAITVAILAILVGSAGCSIIWPNNKKTVVKFSDIKVNGKDTGLSDVLNIDGYYEGNLEYTDVVLFYPDGFMTFNSRQGVYQVEGDSVIVSNLYTLGEAPDNSLTTAKFRIVDRNNIELIWLVVREKDYDALSSTCGRKMSFVKLDSVPPFKIQRLAKEKFIWDNEADMKKWLDNHKSRN